MTELKEALQKILARHDPESLICLGAPATEYMPEARKIAAQLSASQSLEQIEIIVSAVFHTQFDTHNYFTRCADTGELVGIERRVVAVPPGRDAAAKAVAHEIHRLLSGNDTLWNLSDSR
jgi:hypothetical protein